MRSKTVNVSLFICFLIAMVFCAYKYSLNDFGYLKQVPPKEEICGKWIIDPDRTTWRDAIQLLNNKSINPDQGYLSLTSDGLFTIHDLPDFSKFVGGPIRAHQEGSGKWWVNTDIGNNYSHIWLDFKSMGGTPTKDKNATIYFIRDKKQLFFHIIINDPDYGDTLVLKKRESE